MGTLLLISYAVISLLPVATAAPIASDYAPWTGVTINATDFSGADVHGDWATVSAWVAVACSSNTVTFYKSVNAGITWAAGKNVATVSGCQAPHIAAADANRMSILSPSSTGLRVFDTANGGTTWVTTMLDATETGGANDKSVKIIYEKSTGNGFACQGTGDVKAWRRISAGAWASVTLAASGADGCSIDAVDPFVVITWVNDAADTVQFSTSENQGATFGAGSQLSSQIVRPYHDVAAFSSSAFTVAHYRLEAADPLHYFITNNGGNSFSDVDSGETKSTAFTTPPRTFWVAPQNIVSGVRVSTADRLMLTTDGGGTWTATTALGTSNGQSSYQISFAFVNVTTPIFFNAVTNAQADARVVYGDSIDISTDFCPFNADKCTATTGFNRAIREVRTSYGGTPTVYAKEAGDTARINGVLEDTETGFVYKYDLDLGLDASRRPCGDGASVQSLYQNPGGFPFAVSTNGDPWTACAQKPVSGTFSAYYFRQRLRPDLFIAQNYQGTDPRSVVRIDAASNLCTAENRVAGKTHVYGVGYYQTDPGEGGFGIDPSSAQPNVAIAGPNGVQIVQCREAAAGGTGRILNDATKTGYRAAATYNSASWNLTAPTNKAWFADANSVDEFTISGTSLSAGQSYTNGGVDTGFVGQGISAPGIRVSKDGAYIILWDARVHVIDSESMAAVFKTPTISGRIVNGCDMDLLNNYLFCGVQSSAGGVGATSSQVLRWNVFNATSAFGNNAGASTPNPAPSAAENPYDTPTGGTSGQGNPVTGNDPHETFLGNDLTTTASGIGWSVGQLSWLLGVVMVMGFMGGVFAATRSANVALVATGAGILVAVAFGLFPWWFLLFVILCGVALWFTVRGGVTAG